MKLLQIIFNGLTAFWSKLVLRNIKDDRGFGLIEILVAIGIMAIAMTGMMSAMTYQSKELKASDEKMSQQGIQTLISNVLSSSTYCGCFIGGNTFNYTTKSWNGFPTVVQATYDTSCAALGTPFMTLGSKIGNTNLKPVSMALQNITETITNSGNFTANLIVKFDHDALVRTTKDLSVPVTFKVNMSDPVGTRGLSSCSSTGGGSQWRTAGADIYFDTGNVGIKTTTPRTALDVNGAVFIGDTTVACDESIAGLIRNVITGGGGGPLPAPVNTSLQQCRRKGTLYTDPFAWLPVTPPKRKVFVSGEWYGNNSIGQSVGWDQISLPYSSGSTYILDLSGYFCGTNDTEFLYVEEDVTGSRVLTMRKNSVLPGCMWMTLTDDRSFTVNENLSLYYVNFRLFLPAGVTVIHARWRVVVVPPGGGY